MTPPTIYKTAFVRIYWWDRSRSLFTKNLEDMLNSFAKDGWEIMRYDQDKRGVLLIGRKFDIEAMKKNIPDIVGPVVIPIPRPSGGSEMSPMTQSVVGKIMKRLDGEHVHTETELAEKVFGVVEQVCRSVPNIVLRTAVDEIRIYSKKHREEAHEGAPDGCAMSTTLESIVVAIDRHISRTVV